MKKESAGFPLPKEDLLPCFRIGDYARKMGVTPDFLKHYEQHHLVSSEPRDNGYRYYPFRQSFKVLECLRLRGCGFPIREMSSLLSDDNMDTIIHKLHQRSLELERQIQFEQAVVDDLKRFFHRYDRIKQTGSYWQIIETEDMLFLPHTHQYDFLNDERIYALLEPWQNLMPMVKSCMRIPLNEFSKQGAPDFNWGLIVSKRIADEFALPVNSIVITLPRRKLFLFDFYCTENSQLHYYTMYQRHVYEKMSQMGLTPTGDIHMIVNMYSNINSALKCCGTFAIPID